MRKLVLLAICALTAACNEAVPPPEEDPPIATISGKKLSEAVELRDGNGGFLPLLQVNQAGIIKLACKGPDRTTRWIINRRAEGLISVVGDTGRAGPDLPHQWRQMHSLIVAGDPMREPHHPPALQAFELADGLITRYAFLSGSVQVISIPGYAGDDDGVVRGQQSREEMEQRIAYLKDKGVLVAEGVAPLDAGRLHHVFKFHATIGGLFEQPAALVQSWPCKAA